MKLQLNALGCLAALLAFNVNADPGEGLAALAPSKVLLNADGAHERWNGIGRIASKKGLHCTATLIDTRSTDSPVEAPAYVLTNGHCISRKNGLIITNGAIDGTVQFNYFADTAPRSYPLKRISWSSMQGVDLAIVELQPTLKSLIDDGIRPLRLAKAMPAVGQDILWVGAPLYHGTGHLRMAACSHQPSSVVLYQPWVWRRSVVNRCKDIDTGASGSPLLLRDSNEIYAVANLVTRPAPADNTRKELPVGYPDMPHGSNFGSPVTELSQCFVAGVLSSDPLQCSLFPTFSVSFNDKAALPKQFGKVQLSDSGAQIYPRWDLDFTLDQPFYRFKRADSALDCENPAGYGPATRSQQARITEPVGPEIGMNWLCIIGLASTDERPSLGLMRNALTLAMELQPAGPTAEPQVSIQKSSSSYSIRWLTEPGLIDHYTVKIGPPATTDCADPTGFRRRLGNLTLRTRSLPKKICSYAHDINGQRSMVREDIVDQAAR